MNNYLLQAPYDPRGDQPKAIKDLVSGVNDGKKFQTLLGATGTGKTFTIANVIAQTGRPALVLAHNKTLAAQLCNELRQFFPKNAVEYFISYIDRDGKDRAPDQVVAKLLKTLTDLKNIADKPKISGADVQKIEGLTDLVLNLL